MVAKIDTALNKIITIQTTLILQMGQLRTKTLVGLPKVEQLAGSPQC